MSDLSERQSASSTMDQTDNPTANTTDNPTSNPTSKLAKMPRWWEFSKRNNTRGRRRPSNVSPSRNTRENDTAAPTGSNTVPLIPQNKGDVAEAGIGNIGNPPVDIPNQKSSPEERYRAHGNSPAASGGPSSAAGISTDVVVENETGSEICKHSPASIVAKETDAQRVVDDDDRDLSQPPQQPEPDSKHVPEPKITEKTQNIEKSRPVQISDDARRNSSVDDFEDVELLWDAAYNGLKEQYPDLLDRYERAISARWIREKGTLNRRVNELSQKDTTVRRAQMAKALEGWLEGIGEESGDGTLLNPPSWARALRKIMKSTIQRPSRASLAWLATCLGTQGTLCHGLPSGMTRPPIIYVASKMPWYFSLPILIPQNEGTTEDPSVEDISDPVSRADAFKDGIVNLYKAILHVGILSACFGLEDSPRSLDSRDLDDPTYRPSQHCPQYEDIIRLEQVLAVSLGGLRVEDQLHRLLEVAHPQEDDTSPTSELIKKLNVAHQPISNNWDFLRNTSHWSMEIAKEIDLTGGGGNQVVWVTGDVTSKTIFLQSLVQRLLGLDALSSSAPKVNVAYLFHDNELKSRRGNSTSIVRNLIWQVLHSQHLLSRHLEDKISATKRDDFDDPNDFYALSTLLCALLRDDELDMTYFILDGLEQLCGNPSDGIRDPYEDKWGLADIVRLIVTTSRLSNRVRWLVSTDNPDTVMGIASQLDVGLDRGTSTLPITELSGNIPEEGEGGVPPVAEIENMAVNEAGEDQDPQFIQTSIKVSLVDNSIRRAANRYTELKVHELARKADYGGDLRRQVTEKLQTCSEGNLLWVNLACDIIEAKGVPWNAPRLLESLERDVFDLYDRMRAALRDFGEDDEKFCNDILTTAAVAFRPLSLAELADLVKLPAEVNLKVIVGKMCFTFLEITEGKVCFKHAAAYEYLRKHMKEADVLSQAHVDMVKRCLDTALNDLSYRNDEGRSDDGNPKPANYAAVHWIRHLSAIEISQIPNVMGYVNKFLTDHFLEWLGILSSHRLLGQAQTHLQILDASWAKKAGDGVRGLQSPHDKESLDESGALLAVDLRNNIKAVIWFLEFHHGLHSPEELSPQNTLLFSPQFDGLRGLLPSERQLFGLITAPIIRQSSQERAPYFRILEGHKDYVQDCAYSPDGRLVASVSEDQTVRLWDSNTGRVQHVLEAIESDNYLSEVAFSPKCWGLLAAADISNIRLWQISTGTLVKTLRNIGGHIKHIAFSSDGDYLIAVTPRMITRWRLPSYDQSSWEGLETQEHFSSPITCACLSNGENLIAWATLAENVITVWDTKEAEVRHRLVGHLDEVNDINFSPDSVLLASCSDDYRVLIWNSTTGEMVTQFEPFGWPRSLAFSPDGLRLVCAFGSNVQVRKLVASTPPSAIHYKEERVLVGHRGRVTAVNFSPDGKHILSSSTDGTTRIWNVYRAELSVTADDDAKFDQTEAITDSQDPPQTAQPYHTQPISLVAFSPDGKVIASASDDGRILLWDADKGNSLRALADVHKSSILSLQFSRDGSILLSTSSDYTSVIWYTSSGRMICMLGGHTDWVRGAVFSPDGLFVASASDDGTVRVWDIREMLKNEPVVGEAGNIDAELRTLTKCVVLSQHDDYVYCVAFSLDGRYLASGGDENRILIWDGRAGDNDESKQWQKRQDTEGNDVEHPYVALTSDKLYDVRGLVFAPPDGETLLSTSSAGVICAWKKAAETQAWELSCSIKYGPYKPFRSLHFDPEHPDVLLSDNGALLVRDSSSWAKASLHALRPRTQYELIDDGNGQTWITQGGKKLIYLPPQYRRGDVHSFHIQGDRVAIGCDSGDVLIFRFGKDDNKLKTGSIATG